MTAHSENFPWPSYYGHFNFFEKAIRNHSRVRKLEASDKEGVYHVKLDDGRTIRTFVCECYSFGVAEYHEVLERVGRVDAVVISSNWCGYTGSAKRATYEDETGLFSIRDFMAALNKRPIWTYTTDYDRKRAKKAGWSFEKR